MRDWKCTLTKRTGLLFKFWPGSLCSPGRRRSGATASGHWRQAGATKGRKGRKASVRREDRQAQGSWFRFGRASAQRLEPPATRTNQCPSLGQQASGRPIHCGAEPAPVSSRFRQRKAKTRANPGGPARGTPPRTAKTIERQTGGNTSTGNRTCGTR